MDQNIISQAKNISPTRWRLGAYEAGAYQALYERITKTDREKEVRGKPFLDIVAGTSISALNAAIIVSYVVENNTWEGSSERQNEF